MQQYNSETTGAFVEHIAVDIGSTVIKVALLRNRNELAQQQFFQRDFDREISHQVTEIVEGMSPRGLPAKILMCSSANGGLRVGILCLTSNFSGTALRNQALLAGANPVFVKSLDDNERDPRYVDVLLIGGGIDCTDSGPLQDLLENLSLDQYRFGSAVFAGNKHLARVVQKKCPELNIIDNPLSDDLNGSRSSVFEALRDAYLDDLVHKKGVNELGKSYDCAIRPTPEVVNKGYYRAISDVSNSEFSGASILIDIGGATTDVHYTVEIIREDSEGRPPFGSSVARYVFTDLGVVASYDSTLLQLRCNTRTFELLDCLIESDAGDCYRLLREGEYTPTQEMLAYSCIFLSLDRFSKGDGPGLPTADINKMSNLILTGGAVQSLDPAIVRRVLELFMARPVDSNFIIIDKQYRFWIDGIT